MKLSRLVACLVDVIPIVVLVAIESCIDLWLAPSGQDPDEIVIVVMIVFDLVTEYLGFRLSEVHVHHLMISLIPV